jgi:hypothetical protein
VFQKSSGCILEAVEFDNGKVVATWLTTVPEVAVYENLEQFLSVRTPERGYIKIYDSNEHVVSTEMFISSHANILE